MKKILTILCAICTSIIIHSCEDTRDEPISGVVFSENFVQVYVIPDEALMRMYYNGNYIIVDFKGRYIGNSINADKAEYEVLSTRYNDKSFNNKLVPFSNIVLPEEINAINVVCDNDFDDEHPAGTSLNDVIKICASSPLNFIDNGYKPSNIKFPPEFDHLILANYYGGYDPIFKKLSDIEPGDLLMMDKTFYLYLTKQPGVTCNFTITLKYKDVEFNETVAYEVK